MSVSGGFSGRDDSQEALSQAAADRSRSCNSSSTPGFIGKTNSERVVQSKSRGAGALRSPKFAKTSHFGTASWMQRLLVATTSLFMVFCLRAEMECAKMVVSDNSAVASVFLVWPQASLQVALHVTKRQDGATASNRVSVSGGFSGRDDSQEALSKAAADRAFSRRTGGINAGGTPGK